MDIPSYGGVKSSILPSTVKKCIPAGKCLSRCAMLPAAALMQFMFLQETIEWTEQLLQ